MRLTSRPLNNLFKTVVLMSGLFLGIGYVQAQTVFPGANWATATPDSQDMDSTKLNTAISYLSSQYASYGGISQMVIIRNGYMIHNGGSIDSEHGIWSCSKSFASTVLGHMIDRGMCGLNDLAKNYVSALASQYPNVTLRHFATMTSGYDGAGGTYGKDPDDGSNTPLVPNVPVFSPGTKFSYFDDAMRMNGYVLTKIAGTNLDNYFRTYIARPIGMPDASWAWTVTTSQGSMNLSNPDGVDVRDVAAGVTVTARELARLGHLFLNRGNWNGTQIISAGWVDAATSVQVPNTMTGRTDTARQQDLSVVGVGGYGYNWWVNGVLASGIRLMPDVPSTVYMATGYNDNFCFVIPDWNIVVVRMATTLGPASTYLGEFVIWNNFLKLVGESIGVVPQGPQSVDSFTLINADTDQAIAGYNPISDGATLDLSALPTMNLNIRANTSPSTVGSIKFGLDGNDNYRTESGAPYALAGDTSGNYNAWTPSVGSHQITATPYTAAGAGGTAGTALTINFSVIDQAVTDTTPPGAPSAVRDGTGTDVGSTLLTTELSANWAASTDPDGPITAYLYAIGTTAGGTNVLGWQTLGNVLSVTKSGLSLTAGTTYYFSVKAQSAGGTSTVTNSDGQYVNSVVVEGDSVVSLTLINADTDQAINGYDSISDGVTLNLATLPTRNLNIRANTEPSTVGSVKFGYDGNANESTESVAPYAFKGDVSGNYNAWTPAVGSHVLTATPYTGAGATGIVGTALTINFSVIDDASIIPSVVSGELKKWHKVTVTFTGPSTSESATPNPFRDYRLNVTFSKGSKSYVAPGYYAADGNSGETSAVSGNKWKVHFMPDETGMWNYVASFRTGTDIAISTVANAGTATSFNGDSSQFTIGASDKTGIDFRGKGLLKYVNKHYLQFAETGEYFIKGGAGSPENFLAYQDFDGTSDLDGTFLHTYSPHSGDWQTGDPVWQSTKGKNIIGALNYLSGKGMNSVYFLTMNVGGDGDDVWPWTGSSEHYRFDCSKLDQWETVFSHMDKKGLMLHVITQEEEIDQLLDGGALGTERKLYYRELIARFGHHLAVVWNLGEENTNTDQQRKDFSKYFHDTDIYDHPVVVHTFPSREQYDGVYNPLLGYGYLEGASLQILAGTHAETITWIDRSASNGRNWIVCLDEQGPANTGIKPDSDDNSHNDVRKNHLWANLMAGGAGCEWYFGYSYANNDLNCEDWRSRDNMWDMTKYALDFFRQNLPFTEMVHDDGLTSNTGDYCFAKEGEVYAIYFPSGGTTNIDLKSYTDTFQVKWYNPRSGGNLQAGSAASVTGPGIKSVGNPPSDSTSDWVVLVGSSSTSTVSGAFIEENGRVVFEAENYDDIIQGTTGGETRDWELQSYIAGYSDNGFMKILPDTRKSDADPINDTNFYDGTSPETVPLCELSWDIDITMTGKYIIWFRSYSGDSEDNGCHFGLDNTSTVESRRGQTCTNGAWHWAKGRRTDADHCGTTSDVEVVINSPGVHTFHCWMREDGFKLDKIVLLHESLNKDWDTNSVGPEESPRNSASDTTQPSVPASVRDGTGSDIGSTTLSTTLSANWDSSTDNESGISGYSYAIGSSPGATDIINWTSLGNLTTVTKTALSLIIGTTYYFSVKAVNGAGLSGPATNSNGQVVLSTSAPDTTPPAGPATVWDGAVTGNDDSYTYLTTVLSANWAPASDTESGIVNYQYAIGSARGFSDLLGWTTISNVTLITKTGLNLTTGTTYYFSVRAVNGYGLTGTIATSDGQYVRTIMPGDTTPPTNITIVRDGTESDVDSTALTTQLSANWDASIDLESGVAKYYYAIGTIPGGSNITGWADNGPLTNVTKTGLNLAESVTYYFSVKAENSAGLQNSTATSNGQWVAGSMPDVIISNIHVTNITANSVIITWTTDKPSSSQVEYGLTADYGNITSKDMNLITSHSVNITGLVSNTAYHFRVKSRQTGGMTVLSGDYTFTTTLSVITEMPKAYPNPVDFSKGQQVNFNVSNKGVEVKIYTLTGKLVKKLTVGSGTTEIQWDGKNDEGQKVVRGIYIYKISENGSNIIQKLAVK